MKGAGSYVPGRGMRPAPEPDRPPVGKANAPDASHEIQLRRLSGIIESVQAAFEGEGAGLPLGENVRRVRAERDRLLAVVEKFAAREPMDSVYGFCVYCEADVTARHEPDCPWLAARDAGDRGHSSTHRGEASNPDPTCSHQPGCGHDDY